MNRSAWMLGCALVLSLLSVSRSEAAVPQALPGAERFSAELRGTLDAELKARGADYVPRTEHRKPGGAPIYTNRLLLEPSPYLQQHAHNPVNWYPWGDDAFADAQRLKRPVLVSIGYSTCHWCHVMEEESFDNVDVATYLNANYIAIKVDREVRPDVDAVYMSAVHAMRGSGGWPLNVWLTPDRKPFFGGTYFPPVGRGKQLGFLDALKRLRAKFNEQPDNIEQSANQILAAIRADLEVAGATQSQGIGADRLHVAVRAYQSRFDAANGGVGQQPKFPSSLPIRFLLRYHRRTGDARALEMARLTLRKMADGGIHDQVGGGFHRYSTDRRWLVPHFEKMLYDNARLATAYLEGWQVTGDPQFAAVVHKTLAYVQREMTSPEGAFYSATDADSRTPEGQLEEGYFFTWTPAELLDVLGEDRAQLARSFYNVTEEGNFEGRSILHVTRSAAEVAAQFEKPEDAFRKEIAAIDASLYAARKTRPAPHLDDKILTSWNGLMIGAFASAGLALKESRYVAAAKAAADFVLTRMRKDDRLQRSYRQGDVRGDAFLDDYAYLISGLLDLYEASREARWLREAVALQAVLDRHYADPGGAYFTTADDGEALLVREKPEYDGAEPSANSVSALNLLRLYEYTTHEAYRGSAELLFAALHPALSQSPTRVAQLLLAVDFWLDKPKEIIVVEGDTGSGTELLLAELRNRFIPNRVLAVVRQGTALEEQTDLIPLLAQKVTRKGRATAYVCVERVCQFPTTDPAEFAKQISGVEPLPAAP